MKKIFVIIGLVLSIAVTAQVPIFSDQVSYTSTFNKMVYGQRISWQKPEVTFSFEGNLMLTTMKDQFSRIRSFGEIERGNDADHTWVTHQCLDNSGSRVNLTMAFDKESQTQVIIIFLKEQTYMWFEVEEHSALERVADITDNIESLGVVGDRNFGNDITMDEFKVRVNESGLLIGIENLGDKLAPMIKAAVINELSTGVTSADNKPKRWQKGSSVDDPHIVIERK